MIAARAVACAQLLLACVFAGACHSSVGSTDDSEAPVGVLLEGSAELPAVEIALSARPAELEDSLVQPVTSALHHALLRCSAADHGASMRSGLHAGLTLDFGVQGGRLQPTAQGGTTFQTCLSAAMSVAQLGPIAQARSLTLLLRTGGPTSAPRSASVAP